MTGRLAGALFLAIAAALLAGAREFPPGVGPLPGPAFFPLIIAAVMAALALLLFAPARPAQAVPDSAVERPGRLAAVIVLLAVYLALWGFGGFAPRTLVFLALLLVLFGESWKRAIVTSALMTAGVVAMFQYGLRVTLQ